MINTLNQENVDVYASDPAAIKEQPESPYYEDGVEVGYTAPAKWWNWLWNTITAFFSDGKSDREDLLAELKNVLASASIAPESTDNHQLSKAIDTVCYNNTESYDSRTSGTNRTRPYVDYSYRLHLPATELL